MLRRILTDEDLASLVAGLRTLGPSSEEVAGATGPPPSAVSPGAATPRFSEPVPRRGREQEDPTGAGEPAD
eukprot:9493766-Alexandrium_andersonii.AAC.1